MTKITNTHDSVAISLGDAGALGPGQSIDVEDWAGLKKDKAVASYVDQGILVVGVKAAKEAAEQPDAPAPLPVDAPAA